MAKERITFLRNTVWTHLNQLSQQCVNNDEVKPTVMFSCYNQYFCSKTLENVEYDAYVNDCCRTVNIFWDSTKVKQASH